MASNTPPARLSFRSIFIAVFLLFTLESCSATPARPVAASSKTVKVSNLPPPTSGVLGLSRLIEPIDQSNFIDVYYPGTPDGVPGHTSYRGLSYIYFRCTQPTRRIVLNVNPEWDLDNVFVFRTNPNATSLVIKDMFFNAADDTLIVDMDQILETGVTYEISIRSGNLVIDADDRFGVQAFNSTNADTGETVITIGLTSNPDLKRRFVPCFDDPAYKIPYSWAIYVYYGSEYPPAIAMMNVPRYETGHYCAEEHPTFRLSEYEFITPKMAFRATLFEIVPFSWYDDPDVPPPTECLSRIDQHYGDLLQRHSRDPVFGVYSNY